MKKIFCIFRNDLNNIFHNYAAIITIAALCILPSLYAWFNIVASWDPYSSAATSQIKIGVVNNDEGSELNGKSINLGDKIVDSLKENTQLGWNFMNHDEAFKKLNDGDLYATIEIPKDFSRNITSVLSSDIKKADIKYTVNEKINAIAPKLTDKGATSIVQNIKDTFTETVSNTLLSEAKSVSVDLEKVKPKIETAYYLLKEVQSNFGSINDTLEGAQNAAADINKLVEKLQNDIPLLIQNIDNAKNVANGFEDFMTTSKDSLNNIAPNIKENIKLASELGNDINSNIDIVIDAVNNGNDNAADLLDNLISKNNNLKKINNSILKLLKTLNKNFNILDDTISKLTSINDKISDLNSNLKEIKQNISNGVETNTDFLNNIKNLSDKVSDGLNNLYSNYDSAILKPINSIIDKLSSASEDIRKVLDAGESKLPIMDDLLSIGVKGTDKADDIIERAKDKIPKAEELINNLTEKIDNVLNDKNLDELLDMLKSDIEERTDFLTNPVNLVEEKLFPMSNYGSAMTPFYTTLSLWTGILFLVSLLSLEVHAPEGENYTLVQSYFGKLLLFLSICIIQSIIVSIGDLIIIGIYCLHPIVFILSSILTSTLFCFVVYTLCSVLGNVGKVMAIVLLVFQIGGSGGTFPVELTPKFFQRIHPFLPFTYTVSLMRESIGGIVRAVLLKDLGIIVGIIIGCIIIGVFLKKPLDKGIKKFSNKFKESKLGE